MGIVTKIGDCGQTLLSFGGRTSKDDPRIEACGSVDELCSYLGFARSIIKKKKMKKIIEAIQRDLFALGAEVTTRPDALSRLKSRITSASVVRLESAIKDIEKNNRFDNRFHISGEDYVSSVLDITRTVARRAERRVFVLKRKGVIKNKSIMVYLNRLSDLIYLMARCCESKHCKL